MWEKDALNRLKTEEGKAIFKKWLRGLMSADDVLELKSDYAFEWTKSHSQTDYDVWVDLLQIEVYYLPE